MITEKMMEDQLVNRHGMASIGVANKGEKFMEVDWRTVLVQMEGLGSNGEGACMEQGECKAD